MNYKQEFIKYCAEVKKPFPQEIIDKIPEKIIGLNYTVTPKIKNSNFPDKYDVVIGGTVYADEKHSFKERNFLIPKLDYHEATIFVEEWRFFMQRMKNIYFAFNDDQEKTKCFVFDIDCTLAIKSDRDPYDYTRVHEDTPHHPIASILFMLMRSGAYIVFCTGREEKCRTETIEWLQTHAWYESIPHKHSALYMRAEGDYRPDWEVKEELWKQIEIDHNCEIVAMFDDRKQVIDHARGLGYTVLDVAGNTF